MLAAPRRLAWQPSMRCHQLAMVVACMLPRVSRGVRLAGMSVTPAWSARMGGMRHLSMKAAAVEEMAVEVVCSNLLTQASLSRIVCQNSGGICLIYINLHPKILKNQV